MIHRFGSSFNSCVAKKKRICQNGEHKRKRGPAMAELHLFKWRHVQADIMLLGVRFHSPLRLLPVSLPMAIGSRCRWSTVEVTGATSIEPLTPIAIWLIRG